MNGTDHDAFPLSVMHRYIAQLDKEDKELKQKGGPDSDDPKTKNRVRYHFDKLFGSLGFVQPDHDMRELVPVMERLLPIDDGATGLADGILQNNNTPYSASSKKVILASLARLLAMPDVHERLFGADHARSQQVLDLVEARRKGYQNAAQRECRAGKKTARPPPPPSSSSSSSAGSPAPSVHPQEEDPAQEDPPETDTRSTRGQLEARVAELELLVEEHAQRLPECNLESRMAALEDIVEELQQRILPGLAQLFQGLAAMHRR